MTEHKNAKFHKSDDRLEYMAALASASAMPTKQGLEAIKRLRAEQKLKLNAPFYKADDS